MADAPDSKSGWSNIQCGFESRLRYSEQSLRADKIRVLL